MSGECQRCGAIGNMCGLDPTMRRSHCGFDPPGAQENFVRAAKRVDLTHDDLARFFNPMKAPARPKEPWPEGRKDDGGKRPYHLLAPEFLDAVTEILAFGEAKYGARNWEAGMKWSRPFAACMRHLWDWWRKAGPDPETGKSHLWHAACCIMFLVTYEIRNTGTDDRP